MKRKVIFNVNKIKLSLHDEISIKKIVNKSKTIPLDADKMVSGY